MLVGERTPEQTQHMLNGHLPTPCSVSCVMTSRKPKNQRKPKIQDPASNEQTPDAGGGGYAGESRGGFDPLMGYTTAIGLGAAGIVYARTQATRPVKLTNKSQWATQDQSDYYAKQAALLERTARKMDHPAYFSKYFKENERDKMFTKIEQIKMMNEAKKLRSRANFLSPQRSRKK